MKPGHGEVSSPRATSRSPRTRSALVEAFRRQLDAGHVGRGARRPAPAAGARRRWSRRFDEVPRDAERVIFFPRAAGGALSGDRDAMLLALSATAIVIVALLWEVAAPAVARARSSAAARAARRVPTTPATTPAASAAPSSAPASCCARASTTRSGRCTATSASSACGAAQAERPGGRAATRAARRTPTSIYPHKPIVAYLPQTARAAERVLRRRSRTRRARTAARGCPTPTTCWPSGWR